MRNASTAALLAPLVLALVAGCERVPPDAVAVVNDKPIKRYTFDAYVNRNAQGQELTPEQKTQLLDLAIDVQVLSQEALRQKLDHDPEVAGDIEIQRQMRLANALLRKHLTDSPITEDAIRAEYDRLVAETQVKEFHARHILVTSEAEARDVIKQLDKGAKFDRIARTKSADPGSAKEGGDLGWFTPEQMVPQFSAAVAELETGKYTKAPVQTQFGWHVILKEEERMRAAPPFEVVRERIEAQLREKAAQAYINELRGKAKIVRHDADKSAEKPADAPASAPATAAPADPATVGG